MTSSEHDTQNSGCNRFSLSVALNNSNLKWLYLSLYACPDVTALSISLAQDKNLKLVSCSLKRLSI